MLSLNRPRVAGSQSCFTAPSFSVLNRLGRLAWGCVYYLAFRFSPRPLHFWRALLLRAFGASVGRGVHIYPGVKIWAPWNLVLGDECGIASGATLYSQALIYVGRRTVISQGAYICTGSHDYSVPEFSLITSPVRLEDHVWIAANSFVHPGVTVGAGAVVGACSVVLKDVPGWMICGGHPCKVIKPRPGKDRILAQ